MSFIAEARSSRNRSFAQEGQALRILFVAFSARYAMGQVLDEMFRAMSTRTDCWALVPTNYSGNIPEPWLYRAPCGVSKLGGVVASGSPWAHWKAAAALLHCRPDVIHLLSGEGYAWALSVAITARLMGIPVVITLHDPEAHPGNIVERLNAWIRCPVLALAHTIHIFSAQHLSQVRRLVKRANLVVIAHGSLAGEFLRYQKSGVARERLVLFFGRIQHYKGIDVLLRAMSSLPDDVRVAIAGPGNLQADTHQMVVALGERAELHNRFLSDAEVAMLMQRAAVVALPYRHVTQSSVPAIAAAFGCPVVASALGHFVEEIPALGGLLVQPEDPTALGAALAQTLAARSQVSVRPTTWDDVAASFLELYLSSMEPTVVQNHCSRRGPAQ